MIYLTQLPFPSTYDPDPTSAVYYRAYSQVWQEQFGSTIIPESGLWELPGWLAYAGGYLKANRLPYRIRFWEPGQDAPGKPGNSIWLSPLAQNLDLALSLAEQWAHQGRGILLGGPMASSVPAQFTTVKALPLALPDYTQLSHLRPPLFRIFGQHGCPLTCSFCLDARTARLPVESYVIQQQYEDACALFPSVQWLYIGDKTLGSNRQALENLSSVLSLQQTHKVIAQTRIEFVTPAFCDVLTRMNVKVLELGFEAGGTRLKSQYHKEHVSLTIWQERLAMLWHHGICPILNICAGFPHETLIDHESTMQDMRELALFTWIWNMYNFVPYPGTALYMQLAQDSRLDSPVQWSAWREDGPAVFQPYHATKEELFSRYLDKIALAYALITGENR